MPLPFIDLLKPQNFLSFGPDFPGIELRSLNVLIGPNGCGKSNLLEAISFLRAAPRDFQEVTRKGGGVAEWIWKGAPRGRASVSSRLPTGGSYVDPDGDELIPVSHYAAFGVVGQSFSLMGESLEEIQPRWEDPMFLYSYFVQEPGNAEIRNAKGERRSLGSGFIQNNRSILAQRRDPDLYPELARLAKNYERTRMYREWSFGRSAVFREPQKADLAPDVLAEDFSNLGLFLNRMKVFFPPAARKLVGHLRDLYEGLTDFNVRIDGGTVQVYFTEGDFSIPATRLSDGTLRYLCLLAVLCDPEPPPLVCIEEPELGLHPDILPKLADLLIELSERTQVIITTHSDVLVDAMTEHPEAVIACEKHDGKTTMNRLSAEALKPWLEKYRLGQLWMDGELGAKRW